MANTPISVPPPNSGPEPPGLDAAVSAIFSGQPAAPPDPYAALLNDAAAVKLLDDTRKFCDPGREAFEWGWWRVLLYFLGRQWIYWNPATRTWNDKRLAKWVPKPVTNKIRETYDSIFALLSDITPSVNARPVGQKPANVITAETTDEIMPLIHDEHGMTPLMGDADFWAILLGNAYLHPHWDPNDPVNQRTVQLWQCALCQSVVPPDAIVQAGNKCPNCGSPALQPARDASGQPVTQQIVIGRGKTIVCSPFEILLPLYAQSFEAVDRLIHHTWLPRHEIEDMVQDQAVLKKIQWTTSPQQRSLQLYRSLAMQSDLPMSPSTWQTSGTMGEVEGATVQRLWVKAGQRYPRGVLLEFIGEGTGAVVNRSANRDGGMEPYLPYETMEGEPLWPWIHYAYKRIAGRLYAQGAMDTILQKQDQINQIDSMTQLTANRMGNPIWLEPKGAEVERFTGEPGLIVRWQPVGANGAKPERIAGENPPQSFFALRQQFLGDIEDAAGTYDVVKGAKPAGVEAFSALNLLVERSQSRFTPTFKARGEAYRQWAEIAVELERAYGPDERIRNVQGPNQNWTQKVFQRTKLQGSIAIVVEDGSNTPKTSLGRRAAIEHANQLQLLAPQQNPDQMYAMMQELGVSALVPSLDADVKSALQEQQMFEEWATGGMQGPPPLARMPWHNDQVHLNENRKWMNGDAIREILANAGPAAPMIVQALAMHLQEHLMGMQALAMNMAASGPGGPGGPAAAAGGAPAPGGVGPMNGPGGPQGGIGAGRAAHDSNAQSGRTQPANPTHQAHSAA